MKNILTYVLLLLSFCFVSCGTKSLDVESETSITTDFLYSTPEGLSRAAVALYVKDRKLILAHNGNHDQVPAGSIQFDYSTDIILYRGGLNAGLARLNSTTAATAIVEAYWDNLYQIVGKANEIIYYAKQIDPDLENSLVKQAYGEACLFRAKSYFALYQRFENIYINLIPTTVDNMEGRVYRPSSKKQILDQINDDLDKAIETLDWTAFNGEAGRLTKALAHHIKAQVAMWQSDWRTAANNCDAIFNSGYYDMLESMEAVFSGADHNHKEALYVYQFSANPGGGNTISSGVAAGHAISRYTVSRYWQQEGLEESLEYGGRGDCYFYPNTYLLSLFDKTKDNRYKDMFIHEIKYNNPEILPTGKNLGDVVDFGKSYFQRGHAYTLKYADRGFTNADDPKRTTSFMDVIACRLAETALIAAEAYMNLEGPASATGLEYYNKTYERATSEKFAGPLTIEAILDEHAREMHFEGTRWNMLKRLGLLAERVVTYAGNSKKEDPNLDADYIHPRTNWSDKWWRYPIPQSAIDVMLGYPQNPGW